MILRRICPIVLCTGLVAMATDALAGNVTAEVSKQKDRVTVKIDGQPFTEYLADFQGTPILWPIIGPDGQADDPTYPMGEGPSEAKDHPHHRSMWFNHGNVNGVDFWMTGGTIKHREFVKVEGGPTAVIVTRNDWIGPDGKKVCEDERTFTFGADAEARWIDFDVTVKASDGPVKFGDTKEGSMGVRVAGTMKVDARQGGKIVDSEGRTNDAAWGKRSAWVDYHGPVDGQTVGIAIMNHPSSFRYPTYWHVRTYGLFAANPFGVHDFEGNGTPTDRIRLRLAGP